MITLQRQALLGNVAGMVAHEFNNLMTPVIPRAELALQKDNAAAVRQALEICVQKLDHFARVVDLIFGLARPERQVKTETCNLEEAAQRAIASSIRPFEKDGIEMRVDIPSDLHLRASRPLLEQILLNLLLNARQAMRDRRGHVKIAAKREADQAVIEVADSGVGIPAERLDQVVNPFLAADPMADPCDWHGVGLGLNVCRTIANRFDARLRAMRNEFGGCTFRLVWPLA